MSDNKKYYYLRLKENFFDSEEMKIIEGMPDGYLYSNILLKLYLRSLKTDGRLMLGGKIPYSPEMISSVTGHPVGIVKQAISIFKELGLIEILDNGAIYITDIQNFIGKGSTEADRIREYRKKIADENKLIDNTNVIDCTNVRQKYTRDRVRVRDRVRDINTLSGKPDGGHAKAANEIISCLNEKTKKHYKANTPKTVRLIRARLKEGFTIEDFKAVIEKKCDDWLGNEKMERYLRPETLFGTKFEGYLNEAPSDGNDYDIPEFEDLIDNYERRRSEYGNSE
jgi:predicted phage replisome organizer/uncharacterized phage protein (TIGR02220 family)|nr:MAG TPA: DnaD like replication protein [Caudoviricetes sp.]